MAVPKLLIANQTRVVECVVDRRGTMLPAVPVLTARPIEPGDAALSEIAAVLSSPLASAWLWHAAAGTGLSARIVRLRPALVAGVPWPAGRWRRDRGLRRRRPGRPARIAVHRAYGIAESAGDRLLRWWTVVVAATIVAGPRA